MISKKRITHGLEYVDNSHKISILNVFRNNLVRCLATIDKQNNNVIEMISTSVFVLELLLLIVD